MKEINGGKQMKDVWTMTAPGKKERVWQASDSKTNRLASETNRSSIKRGRSGFGCFQWQWNHGSGLYRNKKKLYWN